MNNLTGAEAHLLPFAKRLVHQVELDLETTLPTGDRACVASSWFWTPYGAVTVPSCAVVEGTPLLGNPTYRTDAVPWSLCHLSPDDWLLWRWTYGAEGPVHLYCEVWRGGKRSLTVDVPTPPAVSGVTLGGTKQRKLA